MRTQPSIVAGALLLPGASLTLQAQMEEYYNAALSLDDILSTATYSNFRRFLKTPSEK